MAEKDFLQYNLQPNKEPYMTEVQVRELIAAALANWTGITRFRTIESTTLTITDFTSSQHDHSNAANGGQITDSALSTFVSVPKGGSGANSLTGILKGNGASAFTALTPLAGTKVYYVSDSSGGAVTRKLTFTDGRAHV